MEKINSALRELGLTERDAYDLPSSRLTFPDGAHYRIEIAGIERASTFQAMIEEASRRKVPVHRVIATVGGATYLDWAEDFHRHLVREKVRYASIVTELIKTYGPRVTASPQGPADLAIPRPGEYS